MPALVTAENLIATLGLQTWPEERRLAFVGQASGLVHRRVLFRLLERLTADEAAAAAELADRPQEFVAFLAACAGADLRNVVDQEAFKVRKDLAAEMEAALEFAA